MYVVCVCSYVTANLECSLWLVYRPCSRSIVVSTLNIQKKKKAYYTYTYRYVFISIHIAYTCLLKKGKISKKKYIYIYMYTGCLILCYLMCVCVCVCVCVNLSIFMVFGNCLIQNLTAYHIKFSHFPTIFVVVGGVVMVNTFFMTFVYMLLLLPLHSFWCLYSQKEKDSV